MCYRIKCDQSTIRLEEENKDKICRLILSEVMQKNEKYYIQNISIGTICNKFGRPEQFNQKNYKK
jgi:hypothetical protein